MELEELMATANGRQANGDSNVMLTFLTEVWNLENQTAKELNAKHLFKQEIEIQRHGKYIQVDVIFLSELDADLKITWNLLENYGSMLSKLTGDEEDIIITSLTIIPEKYDGDFYIVGRAPAFWALQSNKPGKQNNIIRIIFEVGDFLFYEAVNIDFATVEAEAIRAIEQREALMMAAEIEAAKRSGEYEE